MTHFIHRLALLLLPACALLSGAALALGWLRPPAVLAYANETDGVFLVDVDQGRRQPLYRSIYRTTRLTWQPGGALLLAENTLGSDSTELALIVPGGAARTLSISRVMSANWSPDGRYIILDFFQSAALFALDAPCLLRRIVCEQVLQAISAPPPYSLDTFAGFSPDGRWLIFNRIYEAGGSEVDTLPLGCIALNTCGDQAVRLMQNDIFGSFAALAPDGIRLVYFSTAPEPFAWQFVSLSACFDEAAACAASPSPGSLSPQNFSPPVWSPDARWLSYVANDSGVETLYLIDAAGCFLQTTANCAPLRVEDAPALDFTRYMRWSPDSRWLLYRRANVGLFVVDLACFAAGCPQAVHPLVAFYGFNIDWSPDSRRLAFVTDNLSGLPALYLLDLACLNAAAGCRSTDMRRVTVERISAAPVWQPPP